MELQVIKLTEEGIREKGIWNSTHDEMMTFNDDPILTKTENLRNTTFRVIIPMVRRDLAGEILGNKPLICPFTRLNVITDKTIRNAQTVCWPAVWK